MTPEEIQRILALDDSWHDRDVLVVMIMGIILGGIIFGIAGFLVGDSGWKRRVKAQQRPGSDLPGTSKAP